MKFQARSTRALSLLALFTTLCLSALQAQQYVYVNDDDQYQNLVTAFRVNDAGQMSIIAHYPTLGKGAGYIVGQNSITTAQAGSRFCVFVSNGGSNDIASFVGNPADGTLTIVSGSPFASGGSATTYGYGLAVGANKLLFVGNSGSNSISVMSINSDCSLALRNTYSGTEGPPAGMKVTPNGKFLITAYSAKWIDSWQIDYATEALIHLGPFAAQGNTMGVDVTCDSSTAFVGDDSTSTQIEAFNISATGQLAEVNDYISGSGPSADNVLLSADDTLLFAANVYPPQVQTLSVGAGDTLTLDHVTSLRNRKLINVVGMAPARDQKGLFVGESPNQVGVLGLQGTTLREVPNSPFSLNDNTLNGGELTAVPGKICR